jgi:hypothetical protein
MSDQADGNERCHSCDPCGAVYFWNAAVPMLPTVSRRFTCGKHTKRQCGYQDLRSHFILPFGHLDIEM